VVCLCVYVYKIQLLSEPVTTIPLCSYYLVSEATILNNVFSNKMKSKKLKNIFRCSGDRHKKLSGIGFEVWSVSSLALRNFCLIVCEVYYGHFPGAVLMLVLWCYSVYEVFLYYCYFFV
jgi:hypothetical protein